MLLQPDAHVSGADAIRRSIVDQLTTYATACGVLDEDLPRLVAAVSGPNAPCALKTARLHVAHVNSVCEGLGILVDRLTGYLVVEPGAGRKAYRVHLPEDREQHLFLIAVERMGAVTAAGAGTFWSYSLLCAETAGDEGEDAPALIIALDLVNDGENLQLRTSRRIYLKRQVNPVTGVVTTTDRLATVEGRANLEGLLSHVMAAERFPYEGARVNRAPSASLLPRPPGLPQPGAHFSPAAWMTHAPRPLGLSPNGLVPAGGAPPQGDLTDPYAA